ERKKEPRIARIYTNKKIQIFGHRSVFAACSASMTGTSRRHPLPLFVWIRVIRGSFFSCLSPPLARRIDGPPAGPGRACSCGRRGRARGLDLGLGGLGGWFLAGRLVVGRVPGDATRGAGGRRARARAIAVRADGVLDPQQTVVGQQDVPLLDGGGLATLRLV